MNGLVLYVEERYIKQYLNGNGFKAWAKPAGYSNDHLTTQVLVAPEDIVEIKKIQADGFYRLQYTVQINHKKPITREEEKDMNIELPEGKEVYKEFVKKCENEPIPSKDEERFMGIWDNLTDLEKQVIYMHEVKGLSFEEVGEYYIEKRKNIDESIDRIRKG